MRILRARLKVDAGPYQHDGASSTWDLAFAVGTGVERLCAIARAGLDIDAAAPEILFESSVGCHFLPAIAELRPLRGMPPALALSWQHFQAN